MARATGNGFRMDSHASWSFGLLPEYPDSDDEDNTEKTDDQNPTNLPVADSALHENDDAHNQVQDLDTADSTTAQHTSMVHMDDSNDSLFGSPRSESDHPENGMDEDFSPREGVDFPPGFSDEEDGDADFTILGPTFSGRSSKFAATPKNPDMQRKKSPRSDDDIEPEGSPSPKRPRKSLFGNPSPNVGFPREPTPSQPEGENDSSHPGPQKSIEMELEEALGGFIASHATPEDHSHHLDEPITPRDGLRKGMSTLTLGQDNEYRLSESPPRSNGYGLLEEDDDEESGYDDSEELNLDYSATAVYGLRTNIDRENIGHNGSWVDKDKSGNYDPEEEAKKERAERAKAKARRKKGKQPKIKEVVQTKLIVRLRFGDKIGTVLNVTDNYENWPDGWSDVDSEEERERVKRAQERASRPRPPPPIDQTPIIDPAGLVDDLTGHPAARSCKSCRMDSDPLGLDQELTCSAISGGSFPCDLCRELGRDCEPIITPNVKLKCNHCEEDCEDDEENVCSFEMASIGPQEICSQCAEQGLLDCVGRIPDGYKAPRIDLDTILYGPDRPYVHCTNCRILKKRCSVKSKEVRGPCKQCKLSGGCIFYDPPNQPMASKKGKEKAKAKPAEAGPSTSDPRTDGPTPYAQMMEALLGPDDDLADAEIQRPRSPTPQLMMEDANGNRGIYRQIRTSFAHPITFNEDDQRECNFCNMPTYGFMGDFERECHALQWLNGLGYTELHGGHGELNDPTVMCSSCTASRVQIIACAGHDIRRCGESAPDFETLQTGLCQASEPGDIAEQLQFWCSFCFAPAVFRCCLPQPCMADNDGEETFIDGCGLRLCETCEGRLRTEFNGSVNDLAVALDKEPKIREEDGGIPPGKPRADVGFLSGDGLLMKWICALDGEIPAVETVDVQMEGWSEA